MPHASPDIHSLDAVPNMHTVFHTRSSFIVGLIVRFLVVISSFLPEQFPLLWKQSICNLKPIVNECQYKRDVQQIPEIYNRGIQNKRGWAELSTISRVSDWSTVEEGYVLWRPMNYVYI